MVTKHVSPHLSKKKVRDFPRIPLEGHIDLTYRCNNNCRHCWTRIPLDSQEKKDELPVDEIIRIVNEARQMGCQKWFISGGEPLIRPDFTEIFEYITHHSLFYSINTNGTLINPEIAILMKKKGRKWVALYGATADVHDHITRNPGSFEAMLRGCRYLKEAGAGFMIQVIPMKDNYHQFQDMINLAQTLTPFWRVGASWLLLSASGNIQKNREIKFQRLSADQVISVEPPDYFSLEDLEKQITCSGHVDADGDGLFSSCIEKRNDFYVDPYGRLVFCRFIKDPSLSFDLRKSNFKQGWENHIPSLKNQIKESEEFLNNCGSCDLKTDCYWCPVYGYLEHRRYGAKVEYLCEIARENHKFKIKWFKDHRRFYNIAGLSIQVDSDLPIKDNTFHPKLKPFEVKQPGEEMIKIRHRFYLPDLSGRDLGERVFHKTPWTIFQKGDSWIYLSTPEGNKTPLQIMIFNHDHSRGIIYNAGDYVFKEGNLGSLMLCRSDQLLLARVMADKQGFFIHSSGVIFQDRGLLFVGHSEAGKSTMVKMFKDKAEILCDDRIVVRKWPNGFRIHGTWNHGEVSQISPGSAPLKAIFFLEKAGKNKLIPIHTKKEAIKRILACLVKSLVTRDWWEKMFSLVEELTQDVPCYRLLFDKSGKVVKLLENLH